ncbi:DUF481 domain-containing protein [Rhizorhapis sp. SPR117]|uniref:DUF481 domain-containing protein n=1 Tax=Rhizorhapis sp. SPR117 TaxID=2912611 RepID=UPI001F256ADA|nr:DUF481 domain-containing protein [Rhizorhapis sp. SPR117]
MFRTIIALSLLLMPARAFADPSSVMPDAVREMLTAAIANGDESDVRAIAKIARQTYPDAIAEIDAMISDHDTKAANKRAQHIRTAHFWDLWSGQGEFGVFRSTGKASEFGISGGLNLKREGLRWKHLLRANADYRRANGEVSRENMLFAYEPRYQISPKAFSYGLLQYERDPLVGFDSRYSASSGFGYQFIDCERVKLSIDTGPSYRHVKYTDDGWEDRLGLRSSLDFNWKLSPTLTFQQNAYAYIEKDKTSLSSLTALDAKVIARLSARFSYSTAYESGAQLAEESFDTLSKVTLIYDF